VRADQPTTADEPQAATHADIGRGLFLRKCNIWASGTFEAMLLVNLSYIALVFFMLVFSLHLALMRHGNRFLNLLLGILLMGRGLQYLYGWLAENGHLAEMMFVYKLPNVVFFIAPAAYYLYVKGFVSDRYGLGRHEWLHFLPGLIGLYEAVAWMGQPLSRRLQLLQEVDLQRSFFPQDDSGFLSPETSLLLRIGMFLAYVGLAWAHVLRRGVLHNYRRNRVGSSWVLTLLVIGTLGYGMVFASMVWDRYHPDRGHTGFLGSVKVSILLYACIMLFVFRRPRVLYGYAFVAAELDPDPEPVGSKAEVWQSFAPAGEPGRPAGSDAAAKDHPPAATNPTEADHRPEGGGEAAGGAISREKVDEWKRRIRAYMDQQAPYLNPQFRLHHLATALDIPPHHCSYIINIEFGQHFNHWVNEYRVARFVRLHADKASTLTLEALARQSGFANRRTLHNAFLKVHGHPPGSSPIATDKPAPPQP